ncbi:MULTISPECIES: glycine zipper family protein [unclassified Pseudoclavibacter]|uniref:glycine zipper family protein n=1 Tax=unclassified Pseudoclavibacter TaxID=2615177 RepID=UPI0012F05C6D|nr:MULTISPECIES: glycine zipper family protein [unclassified Pseudoclavibacter]MBF4460452.1 glycine zipper family protein [Pseudoclavibacter sp. VKM Ac-2867]VXB81360.1 Glycine zipper family protein [Pseudoclavibacter sp. 8L]
MTEPERSEGSGRKSANAVGIGIALGLPFGAAIGMLLFDNLALGAGLGMLVGIVIGAAYQARSK